MSCPVPSRPVPSDTSSPLQTLEPRAGFLCNFEVLHFLKQQRDERAAEVKVLSEAKAARVSKLGRKAYAREQEDEEIERVQPPELHTISFEVRLLLYPPQGKS